MKIRTELKHKIKPVVEPSEEYEDHSDFYERWYAKFGKPQTRTLPADEFLTRLKEMIEFE